MRAVICWLGFASLFSVALAAPVRDGYPPAINGLIFKDTASAVIVYVETDGRHVVAISPDGKMLWRKDPFVDAKLQPYRQAHPTITNAGPCRAGYVEPTKKTEAFFCVTFSSSQFGTMDFKTGTFDWLGQN